MNRIACKNSNWVRKRKRNDSVSFQRRRFEVVQKSVEKNRTKSGSGSVGSSNKQRTANAIPRFLRLHPFIPSRFSFIPNRFLFIPSRFLLIPSRFLLIPSRFNISFLPFNYFSVLLILLVTTSFKDTFVNFFHTFVSHCTVFTKCLPSSPWYRYLPYEMDGEKWRTNMLSFTISMLNAI